MSSSIALAAKLLIATVTTVTFVGDVLLDRGVRRQIERSGVDSLFTPAVDSVLLHSDRVVANLECPATNIHSPAQKRYIFRAEPEWLYDLRRHGLTHLCLANNHSVDQGRRGLESTYDNIVQAGMVPVGAAATMAQAAQPLLLASEPRRVWLIASLRLALENFAYLPLRFSVSQEPFDSLLSRVATLRAADPRACIVVTLHWGAEHTLLPVPRQRHDAHRLVDAGADLIVGHHTHTLQTVEHYRGRTIYYSIGNFIFDQQQPINTRACMVRLTVAKDCLDVQTLPIAISRCRPFLLHGQHSGAHSQVQQRSFVTWDKAESGHKPDTRDDENIGK